MRLATAADEIKPLKDPRVQSNSSYLTVVLLSRVVTELGELETVDPDVIESLFVTDLEHLQALYEQINSPPDVDHETHRSGRLESTGIDAIDREAETGNPS